MGNCSSHSRANGGICGNKHHVTHNSAPKQLEPKRTASTSVFADAVDRDEDTSSIRAVYTSEGSVGEEECKTLDIIRDNIGNYSGKSVSIGFIDENRDEYEIATTTVETRDNTPCFGMIQTPITFNDVCTPMSDRSYESINESDWISLFSTASLARFLDLADIYHLVCCSSPCAQQVKMMLTSRGLCSTSVVASPAMLKALTSRGFRLNLSACSRGESASRMTHDDILTMLLSQVREFDSGNGIVGADTVRAVMLCCPCLHHFHLRRASPGALSKVVNIAVNTSFLLSLSLGTVGSFMQVTDCELEELLKTFGGSLESLRLQNISKMSCRCFRLISLYCCRLRRLAIISCNDVSSSWKISKTIHEDFHAMIAGLNETIELLDFRYSLQMTDLLLKLMILHLRRAPLTHFLGSRTESAGSRQKIASNSLSKKRWKHFTNVFNEASLLFIDNVTAVDADNEVKYLFQAVPFTRTAPLVFEWAIVRDAVVWEQCK
jgi:hypothetical protein